MGYSALYFGHRVQSWLDAGWLKPGDRLLDFGSQEFNPADAETRAELAAFLRKQQTPQDFIDAALQDDLRVAEIFAAIGVRYSSIDVDGARGSTFFDLNTSEPPAYWRNAFDFANNEGTTEHLVNPINGFQVAHEIVRPGGVIRHNVPLTGCDTHGLLYPTPKFYSKLIAANGYELLLARAKITEPTPLDASLFTEAWDETTGGFANAMPMVTNLWCDLAYRKTADRPFVIPVDHVDGPEADKVRARLVENHRALARSYPLRME